MNKMKIMTHCHNVNIPRNYLEYFKVRRSIVDLAALCADVLLSGLARILFAQLEVLPLLGLPPEGGKLVLVSLTLSAKI